MRSGSRWFLGYNILLLAVGAVVLLTIVAAAFVYSARSQYFAGEALKAARVDRLVLEVISDLADAETAQRGFVITRRDDFLDPYRDAIADFTRDVDELAARTRELADGSDVDIAAVDAFGRLAGRKMDLVTADLERMRAGPVGETEILNATTAGKTAMDAVRNAGELIRDAAGRTRIARAAAMRDASSTLTSLISLGAAMIVVLVFGATLVIRRHMHELEEARSELVEINRDLEDRVRERTAGVLRANEELQRYAYIVSHDLRAPLVNIMGFTAELETSTRQLTAHLERTGGDRSDPMVADAFRAAEEDIPEALGFIRTSMTRMDGLINEILKLSRAGRRVLEPTSIDMQTLISGCIDAIRQRFDEVGAEVTIEGRLPPIVSDRAALQQIFTNILDNAAKYLASDRPGRIVVRGRIERGSAVFEVEDNGRGIAPADHERIFELFRRAGVQDRPGEGIGLAHTRALARRLGGDVTVASDGLAGTVFRVAVARDLILRMGRDER